MSIVTRFAPSPTGALHLGHAFAALFAAQAAGPDGLFRLRIDDLDRVRAKPLYEEAILEDLAWLGLRWQGRLYRQSAQEALYKSALYRLEGLGLLYPCFCTRSDILRESKALQSAPHGALGVLYPGTCHRLSADERAEKIVAGLGYSLRLDTARAATMTGPLVWRDLGVGDIAAAPELLGDVVLARRDAALAYHLAVVIDDSEQGVSLVTRGEDLFAATHLHRLLIALLDLPLPTWHHHRLVTDETGKRLAKRSEAASLAAWRESGRSAAALKAELGF